MPQAIANPSNPTPTTAAKSGAPNNPHPQPSQTHAPKPESTRPDDDDARIHDYLDPSLPLCIVAQRNKISVAVLLQWLRRPDIVELLDNYEKVCIARARRLAADATPQAVETTIRCLYSDKPETARRAASTLIRLSTNHPTAEKKPGAKDAQDKLASSPEPEPGSDPAARVISSSSAPQSAVVMQGQTSPPLRSAA